MTEILPSLSPDPARTQRTLARCHERLARQREALEEQTRPQNPRLVAVERVALAGICLTYLMSMAGNLVRILGQR